MGQTLYAIIAMMIVSLFAIQQQRHALRAQLEMIDNEIQTIASGVAAERLDEIGAMAFDQNTKGGQIIHAVSELTSRAGFGTGEGKDQPSDDLDDADGSSVVITRDIAGQALRFQVDTTVDYADATHTDRVSQEPSKFKVVTVSVRDLDGVSKSLYVLSQSFSCKSACQW